MAWRDQLRPASFRGAPFFVEEAELAAGRRVQLHVYPERDLPYPQDLGRRPREFTLAAYVVGDDYFAARDRLLEALEAPGPGTLAHPYRGTLRAAVTRVQMRETTRVGRLARFEIGFVEAGENRYPEAATDTRGAVGLAADGAETAVSDGFAGAFSVDGAPQFVLDDATQILNGFAAEIVSILGLTRAEAAPLAKALRSAGGFAGAATSLAQTPSSLASQLFSTMGLVRALGIDAGTVNSLLGAFRIFGDLSSLLPLATPARQRQAANRVALDGLVRRAALVERARAVPDVAFDSYDDAAGFRDALAEDFDAEILVAGDAGEDGAYLALTDLRAAAAKDVTERAGSLARIERRTLPATRPALAVAYDLYEDSLRDGEIAARNRLRHPGFVPGGVPLEVLAR